jgi:hypothetical protein
MTLATFPQVDGFFPSLGTDGTPNGSSSQIRRFEMNSAVDSAAFDDKRLVDVTWDDKKVMMFTQDVRSRAERVPKDSK